MKVRDWMLEHIASTHLFLAGLAVIPAFLFQKNLIVRAAVILLFIVLCLVSGKSVKPGYSLVILLTIALFSLLTPMGKVLFRVAGLPVTDRALLMGGYRGLTVVGLFYVSRFCIRKDLELPGKIGGLLSRTLSYFHRFLEQGFPDPRHPVQSLDRILMNTYGKPETEASPRTSTSVSGGLFILCLLLLVWTATGLNMAGVVPSHV